MMSSSSYYLLPRILVAKSRSLYTVRSLLRSIHIPTNSVILAEHCEDKSVAI